MKNIIVLLFSGMILFSCDNYSADETFTAYKYIDINNDSINDYLIYTWGIVTDDYPSSSASVLYWSIRTLCSNSFLFNSDDESFFLGSGDTINREESGNKFWKDSIKVDLISRVSSDGKYIYDWSLCVESSDVYYMGLKYETDSGINLAWLRLNIDLDKGEITTNGAGFTDQNELPVPVE